MITNVQVTAIGWKVTYSNGDILQVPDDSSNRHYAEVQAWLAEPNTPDDEYSLAETKSMRKADVNLLRDQKIAAGFSFGSNIFDAKVDSRASLASYVANVNSGNGLPANFTWRTVDNQDIPFDATSILNLHSAMIDFLDGVYSNSWSHKDSIDSQTTIANVNSYDISTGWPT